MGAPWKKCTNILKNLQNKSKNGWGGIWSQDLWHTMPEWWPLHHEISVLDLRESYHNFCKDYLILWLSKLNPNQFDVWEGLSGLGGGSRSPPLLSWLWSKFLLKNHVSLKAGINSNSFGPFLEFFFKNHQKNRRILKIHQKMAKYERNF